MRWWWCGQVTEPPQQQDGSACIPSTTNAPCAALPPAELSGATSIIFTRTCDSTRKIALTLRNLGFGAVPIHGQMSQPKRLAALNKFKARRGRGERGVRRGRGRQHTRHRCSAPV